MTTTWKVYFDSKFIGIIETNYQFASTYWGNRGKQFTLKPYNEKHLQYPYDEK